MYHHDGQVKEKFDTFATKLSAQFEKRGQILKTNRNLRNQYVYVAVWSCLEDAAKAESVNSIVLKLRPHYACLFPDGEDEYKECVDLAIRELVSDGHAKQTSSEKFIYVER